MIICMIFATIAFCVFAYLFITAGESLNAALITCCKENEEFNIAENQKLMNQLIDNMKKTGDMDNKRKIRKGKSYNKKVSASKKRLEKLDKNKIGIIDSIPLAGYRLIQLMEWDARNDNVKKLNEKCSQYKNQRQAVNYTFFLLASLMAYTLVGVFAAFTALGIGIAMQEGIRGVIVAMVALVVFVLIGYIPYDDVNVIVNKRREDIENEFPQVVSKLALLTVTGMEVNQAWRLASISGEGTLYEEMQRVTTNLDNNVPPVSAYSSFMNRCNNSYTTKLATTIIQNISLGNAEIVSVFRRLNEESWMEHKHNARRKGEQIQSKLLVPTLLMFVGIIILVIVPVMSGFGF